MRHGSGFSSWWKQERKENIVTQLNQECNIFEELSKNIEDCFYVKFVSIYVRVENDYANNWRMRFFELMGGKAHIQCNCYKFPLIPSNLH